MSTALHVIAVLLGLVVFLLAIPIAVSFRFAKFDVFSGQIAVRWLFGLARFRFEIPGAQATSSPMPQSDKADKALTERKARRARPNVVALLKQSAFRRRVIRFVGSLFRAMHAHQLYLKLRMGLGDPADTGRLWAVVGPLSALSKNLQNAEVRIEPEFADPVFEFKTHGRFLLIPLQFIVLAVAFALSPSSIRAWRTMKTVHA